MMPADPVFDAVGMTVWSVKTGIFDMMYSRWGWPIAEIIHFTGLCLLIGAVGTFDLRMLGVIRGLSLKALHRLVPYGVAGFLLCVASGFCFVVTSPDQYLYNPAWQAKMALISIAGINMAGFYITGSSRRAMASGLTDAPPLAARIFAAVSLFAWLGVIATGRVITAFRPPAWFWCAWCS